MLCWQSFLMEEPRKEAAFVLRLSSDQPGYWRCSLQPLRSEVRRYFPDLQALQVYLQVFMEELTCTEEQ